MVIFFGGGDDDGDDGEREDLDSHNVIEGRHKNRKGETTTFYGNAWPSGTWPVVNDR